MRRRRFLTNAAELIDRLRHTAFARTKLLVRTLWLERYPIVQTLSTMQLLGMTIAMYGAGIINCMFMPRWAVLLLLVPLDSDWDFNYHSVLREQNQNAVVMTEHHLVLWQNTDARHSFPPHGSRTKDTYIEPERFVLLVGSAMNAVGVPKEMAHRKVFGGYSYGLYSYGLGSYGPLQGVWRR